MKANQAFKANDEAVSPVIGVILMVAITVVLAAVVFVLVSNLSENANTSNPQVAFTSDEMGTAAGGVLTVAGITNGPLSLDNIVIGGAAFTASGSTCTFNNGSDAIDRTGTNAGKLSSVNVTADLKAGDQIKCTAAGTITISSINPSVLLYSGSFS